MLWVILGVVILLFVWAYVAYKSVESFWEDDDDEE